MTGSTFRWLVVLVNDSNTFSSSGVVTNGGKFDNSSLLQRSMGTNGRFFLARPLKVGAKFFLAPGQKRTYIYTFKTEQCNLHRVFSLQNLIEIHPCFEWSDVHGCFFSLRKFIGPKNPLWLSVLPILCFCAGAQKNMAAKFKGRARREYLISL